METLLMMIQKKSSSDESDNEADSDFNGETKSNDDNDESN